MEPVQAARIEAGQGGRSNPYLLMPITLFFILLGIAVLRAPNLMTNAGIGSAIIVATPLILATYALMATVISGRGTVDLSVGPLIGFVNVTLVQLHDAGYLNNPFAVFGYALLIGALYQLIFALIVLFVRVQPIIVSLSGYLALSGINLVILPRPGGTAPGLDVDMGPGNHRVLARTRHPRPRHARLDPVRADGLLHAPAADGIGRARRLHEWRADLHRAHRRAPDFGMFRRPGRRLPSRRSIGSGDPSQGTTYTLIAVTALVLGGASLAGGRAACSAPCSARSTST